MIIPLERLRELCRPANALLGRDERFAEPFVQKLGERNYLCGSDWRLLLAVEIDQPVSAEKPWMEVTRGYLESAAAASRPFLVEALRVWTEEGWNEKKPDLIRPGAIDDLAFDREVLRRLSSHLPPGRGFYEAIPHAEDWPRFLARGNGWLAIAMGLDTSKAGGPEWFPRVRLPQARQHPTTKENTR